MRLETEKDTEKSYWTGNWSQLAQKTGSWLLVAIPKRDKTIKCTVTCTQTIKHSAPAFPWLKKCQQVVLY